LAAHSREWLCHRILFLKLLEEGADLVLLEVGVVEVEGEFEEEHEQEDEEAEEDGGVKLSAPDAEGDAGDHDEGAEGCKGTEEEDAGSAAESGGGDQARREIGEDESCIREKGKCKQEIAVNISLLGCHGFSLVDLKKLEARLNPASSSPKP
jgi:hypothetical protein